MVILAAPFWSSLRLFSLPLPVGKTQTDGKYWLFNEEYMCVANQTSPQSHSGIQGDVLKKILINEN